MRFYCSPTSSSIYYGIRSTYNVDLIVSKNLRTVKLANWIKVIILTLR